jgi:hypothetical protein
MVLHAKLYYITVHFEICEATVNDVSWLTNSMELSITRDATSYSATRVIPNIIYTFPVIPFYLQSVLVHSVNCVNNV